jgi:hypothetical protein
MTGWGASTEYDGYFNTVFTPEEQAGIDVGGVMEFGVQAGQGHGHGAQYRY